MSALFLSIALMSSIFLAALPGNGHASAGQRWNTYRNSRFNYSISYPASLVPQGEAANGDGQVFRSPDSTTELRVWASHNTLNQTLAAAYEQAIADFEQGGGSVSYKVRRGNFFVVSGTQSGKIVYQKTLLRGDVFKAFIFAYPVGAKSTYDPVTTRIAGSFKG